MADEMKWHTIQTRAPKARGAETEIPAGFGGEEAKILSLVIEKT